MADAPDRIRATVRGDQYIRAALPALTAYLAEQGYAVVATSGPKPIDDDIYALLADAKAIIGGLTTINHRRMGVWQRITAVLAREDDRRAALTGETK